MPVHDFIIPPEVEPNDIARYLDDVFRGRRPREERSAPGARMRIRVEQSTLTHFDRQRASAQRGINGATSDAERTGRHIAMSFADEFNLDDEPPSVEELELVRRAGTDTRNRLDEALLRSASNSWRKMARLVADAMTEMETALPAVSESYYSYRLRELVAFGRLEARGKLSIMRFCELRLRSPDNDA